MAGEKSREMSGQVIEEETELTIAELCRSCGVHAEIVVTMVEEGILEPSGDDPPHWCFPAPTLRRVTTAVRLQHDLGINLAGVALALDLLDRIDALKARLRAYERPGGR